VLFTGCCVAVGACATCRFRSDLGVGVYIDTTSVGACLVFGLQQSSKRVVCFCTSSFCSKCHLVCKRVNGAESVCNETVKNDIHATIAP